MGIIRFEIDPIRTLGFGNINNVYSQIGSNFNRPIRQIKIDNTTDADLMFSFNGNDDHLFAFTLSSLFIDVSANSGADDDFYISAGKGAYVRHLGSAPTSGTVYVSVIFGVTT